MRFLPGVANLVLEEFPVRVERFSTLVACECFVCGMSSFVFFQIAHVVESCENQKENSSIMTKKLNQTANLALYFRQLVCIWDKRTIQRALTECRH